VIAVTLLACLVRPIPASNAASEGRSAPELYRKYCLGCHGSDGRAKTQKGKRSHARDLTDATWQNDVTDERIFNSIMNGRNTRGNMPGFTKDLSADEADSLVDFVRKFRS
jgi:mono/diheme cytochrome c family protein